MRHPIEILPLPVVEKIAAGEVIERPASVLKELIENSIDAGATRIETLIEGAGFSKIKIMDNGCGMPEADLAKALLRYATSKIRTSDDLFAITTMGFRGEALASVAAVSRLTISTSADNSGLGHEIASEGGVHGKARPVAHGQGTTIEVRDLFFNVPARKKFMKSARSEQMALSRGVEQVAAAFPGIHFLLSFDGSRVLDLPPVEKLIDRIGQIGGNEFVKELIECSGSRPGMEAVVWVSSPEVVHSRPRFQNLYINLRRADNESVLYAIREGFGRYLSSQFKPSFFCFLSVDPSRIDVNVHPTKQQVKFEDERALFGFIFSTVLRGIGGRLTMRGDFTASSEGGYKAAPKEVEPDAEQGFLPLSRKEPPDSRFSVYNPVEADAGAQTSLLQGDAAIGRSPLPGASESSGDSEAGSDSDANGPDTVIPFPNLAGNRPEPDHVPLKTPERETAWDLISCYQIHEMYILAPIKNGILLIDQHAAHERILFEQALDDIDRGRAASQQLLFPVVVEMPVAEKAVVLSGLRYFSSFGFEVSDFGGNAVAVSAIPFFMRTADAEDTVRSMVRYLLDEQDRDALRETERRFAAAFACGAAIKAGQKLTPEEMTALVNSLFATKSPYTCPHGRPTLVRISLDELGRRFLRM